MRSSELIIIGGKALIFDEELVNTLYSKYFIGKPFGVEKPKPGERYKGPLELSLLEAVYLCESGLAKPRIGSQEITCNDLIKYALKQDPRFKEVYIVYRDLRDKGFVVRSGMKYGVDFAVYEKGPGLEHAPYLVQVYRNEEYINPIHIVRIGRLSHSVRKTLIFAVVEGNEIRYVSFGWIKF